MEQACIAQDLGRGAESTDANVFAELLVWYRLDVDVSDTVVIHWAYLKLRGAVVHQTPVAVEIKSWSSFTILSAGIFASITLRGQNAWETTYGPLLHHTGTASLDLGSQCSPDRYYLRYHRLGSWS